MNPWITSQVVYLSIYLLAVYTGIVTGSDYEINGTQTNAKVYTTAEPGVNIRTVVGYNKYTKERATSYQLSSPRLAYFVINKNTGTISTALKINQTVGYQFSLTVIAKFGHKSTEHRNLRVDVVQMNREKPQFNSPLVTFIIHRRTKNGTVIGQLSATDQSVEEYNRRLTYSIQMQDEPKVFEVKKDGKLLVIGKIPTYADVLNFTALASDNGYPTKKAWQFVSVKISNIPALTKFCTVKDDFDWRICWKYEPPSSQRYVYHIEIRSGMYTHNNSVVGGTEHCYSAALLDGPDSKYFYRVQTRLGNNRSPFSEWKEAVDKGPDCELFDPCHVFNPCSNGGSCIVKANSSSQLQDRYICICPHGWQGTHCRTSDGCAHTTCLNQGTCIMVSPNKTKCKCLEGYLGELCEFVNHCTQNPCFHGGTCQMRDNASYECYCPPPYVGSKCEALSPCNTSDCNNGECIATDEKNFYCKCEKGYTGQFCELYNPCIFFNPCENNGTCEPSSETPAKYICKCTENYIGANCSQLDPCEFIHCENGGTCSISGKPGQHCKCLPGFIGGECQREDKCYHQQPCKNGATCIMNLNDTFVCHCTNGFTGDHCELIDPCAYGLCSPNTSRGCIRLSDTKYRCSCTEGYTGDFCETAISSCRENPCRNNGSCIVSIHATGYQCYCKPGFHGVHCDEMDSCRDHDCKNGATCRSLNDGTFRCHCPVGFSGTRCETLTFCSSSTCLNGGNCSNGARPNDTICSCPQDYYGQQCEFFNHCNIDNNACLNKGTCVIDYKYSYRFKIPRGSAKAFLKNMKIKTRWRRKRAVTSVKKGVKNGFRCVCRDGFTGQFCENPPKDVDCDKKNKCANGGTCLPTGVCRCQSNYTGNYCDQLLNACYSRPCLNGGSCKVQLGDNGFTCSCMPFFQGEFCEINNICQEKNPCNEQSVCMNTENGGYKCVCKPPFSGTNCTIKASCNEDIQKDDTGRYVWPVTVYGRTAIIPCKYAKSAGENASRPCIFNTTLNQAQWGRMDTSNCEKIGDEEASKAMKNLRSLTEHPQTLTAEQVANVTEKLEEIFSYSLKKREIAANMVQVISNMLEANTTVMSTSNKMNNTSERLKRLLENYSANVSISENTVIDLQSSNIILKVQEISTTEKWGQTMNLHPIFEDDKEKKLEFVIPWDSIKENHSRKHRSRKHRKTDDSLEERVQMIAYNNAKFYISENQSETNINDQSVIFVKIKGRELKNLAYPVTYTISNLELNQNHTCVYWDTISKNWSTEGIVTKVSSFNETVCESDHLTSFSLLLAVSPEKPLPVIHEMVLTYISYIGCSISIFGIVLTIITYGLFGCLHGDPSGRILLNLCSSLLFLNVSFLMASQVNTLQVKYNETSAETLCIIVAILIHYFLLTTLAWMCVEAINMYQMLVTVFNIYHSRFMLKRVLAAWGIPALTVGITLGIDIRNYKTAVGYCFLSYGNRTAFYVALLTPACIILFINTVVFGMVTKVIVKPKFKNKHQCSSAVSSVQVRGCFTVMVLLGVTWLFGPLAINEMKIFFNYLFCILNSLQGFFIFVFRCLLNPEAKMAWVQLIKMGTLKKKKGPRKSVDSSSNGMYGGGGGGGGGQLGHRWSQKTMTVDIRDNTNLKKLSKPNDNGIYEKNISYESCRNKWDQSNGSTYQSDKPVEFTRL